jgi:hypothetical protein
MSSILFGTSIIKEETMFNKEQRLAKEIRKSLKQNPNRDFMDLSAEYSDKFESDDDFFNFLGDYNIETNDLKEDDDNDEVWAKGKATEEEIVKFWTPLMEAWIDEK